MKLPNGDQAVIEARKLSEYCLSPTHPRGRHKARVFAAVLGIEQKDAAVLRDALRRSPTGQVGSIRPEIRSGFRNVRSERRRRGTKLLDRPRRRGDSATGDMLCDLRRNAMTPKLLDVVALLEGVPAEGLVRGQVGTIVEELDGGVFEVEFSDNEGHAYATRALRADQVLVLHHEAVRAA